SPCLFTHAAPGAAEPYRRLGAERERMSGAARLAAAALVLGVIMLLDAEPSLAAANYPPPTEGDFTIRNFQFTSGETLPELRIHHRTFGRPRTAAKGVVRNAVLVMHGTGGNGGSLVRAEFAGELFAPGQLLDASRYFIVLPDGIGHGQSSKPSDGLHARF